MSKTMADVGREGLNRSSLNRSKSAILFGGEMPKGIYRHGIRQINCKTCGREYSPGCDYLQGRCPYHLAMFDMSMMKIRFTNLINFLKGK